MNSAKSYVFFAEQHKQVSIGTGKTLMMTFCSYSFIRKERKQSAYKVKHSYECSKVPSVNEILVGIL